MLKIFYKLMISLSYTLQSLGFSPEESDIYLACLEFGDLPISTISRLTKIGRINCYHYTQKLVDKGYLSISTQKKVKHFSASNPRILINKEKEKLNLAEQILPEMLAIAAKTPQRPKIQFFEDTTGIEKIFAKMIEIPNSEVVSFSNTEMLKYLPTGFLQNHFSVRQEKEIKTRLIIPVVSDFEEVQQSFFPRNFPEHLLEIFQVSPRDFSFASEISIFSGNIAIFSLSEKNAQGVLIENPELYQTQKAIFDLAWLGATSFITQ